MFQPKKRTDYLPKQDETGSVCNEWAIQTTNPPHLPRNILGLDKKKFRGEAWFIHIDFDDVVWLLHFILMDAVGIEPTTFHRQGLTERTCEAKIIPLDQAPMSTLNFYKVY